MEVNSAGLGSTGCSLWDGSASHGRSRLNQLHMPHSPWSSHLAPYKGASSYGNNRGSRWQIEIFMSRLWAVASFLLPPMKANHIVKPNLKGRNRYILAKDEAMTVRVKNWNSSFNLPQ